MNTSKRLLSVMLALAMVLSLMVPLAALAAEETDATLSMQYRYGTNTLIQVNTDLPATTPIANFTADQNGCNIDQSANLYQQVGWIEMGTADGVIVLTFHFNEAFEAGQYYTLPAGAVFGFTDGSTYTLDKTYVFTWDGTNWTQSNPEPEPEVTELSMQYQYGAANMIAVSTNLPLSTPIANFTASQNGCIIDESGNPYQQVGWIQMAQMEGVIGFAFHFNEAFEAGQYYTLPAGAVFGFTDGSTYTLDKTYVFTWDGTNWTQSNPEPEPEVTELSMQYQYGAANMIAVSTNLPLSTPIANFTASQNGCIIDESGNPYQQVGWIQMAQMEGVIGFAFHFNEAFEAGQYYVLPAGSVFGFTDGKTYPLDKDYVFIWDGSSWTVTDTIPEHVPSELTLQYYTGGEKKITVATNLPASTPCVNFLATDNGCSIDQSGNPYQQVGYIEMGSQGGIIGLSFHFNAAFEAGQYYVLPAGSVFGFTDGKTYPLDKDYVFIWDGSSWTVTDTIPEYVPSELTLQYYTGGEKKITVATNLPASTPCVNFLATDNGCSIDQSGNPYQQVGYIEMGSQGGIIGLSFHFNAAFEAGQYYVLPAGSVFGFTDGKTYPLDKDYVFIWDGSSWTTSNTLPDPEPECPHTELSYVNNGDGTHDQVCVCGEVIIDNEKHTIVHVAESCYNVEHWVCYECETFWADEALTQITNSKNVIKAEASHNIIHVAESCYNTEHWYCDICEIFWADEALTQVTNSKNVIKATPSHNLVHFDAVEPACHYNGNVEYAPVTDKVEASVINRLPRQLGCPEDKNLFSNYNLDDGDAFWGDDSRKFGLFGNAVTVADSGSAAYGNALHYKSDRPNGTYYIKWIDVEPNTEYTFSARYAIAQPGEGFMGLINGYCIESDVTENRLFPTIIKRYDFDEKNYLESLAWQTASLSFKTGERNRIGFIICDAGGEAYIDELRLFKSSDGVALEVVEDTLPIGGIPADTDSAPVSTDSVPAAEQPEAISVKAIVLWSLLGVLLVAAAVSLIIIQKKRKKK